MCSRIGNERRQENPNPAYRLIFQLFHILGEHIILDKYPAPVPGGV